MYLCWFVHLCQEGHIAPDGRIYEKFGMFLKYGDGHIAKVNWVLAFGMVLLTKICRAMGLDQINQLFMWMKNVKP